MAKRIAVALICGAVLGIFCIVGGSIRLGWQGNQLLLFSLWYNRLLLGLLIGLSGELKIIQGKANWAVRGAVLGLGVSAAYFFTAGGEDWISFLAGPVYGILIEYVLRRLKL